MSPNDCPFCDVPEAEIVQRNDLCYARWDRMPVADGHLLVIPFRHFPDYFDATDDEVVAIWRMVSAGKQVIEGSRTPDGYNVGVNVGRSAGQSVMHVHIHVIPRYAGDTADPFGGIRSVVLGKERS